MLPYIPFKNSLAECRLNARIEAQRLGFQTAPFFGRYLFRTRYRKRYWCATTTSSFRVRRNNPIRALLLRDRYLAGSMPPSRRSQSSRYLSRAHYRLLRPDGYVIHRHLVHQRAHTGRASGWYSDRSVRRRAGNLLGRFVDGRIGKQQAAFFRVNCAVVKFDADRNHTIRRQQFTSAIWRRNFITANT